MIDEIERIALTSRQDTSFINFLCELQKLPVVIISTTNSPATDSVEGMVINDDGTSANIDRLLVERVHPDCLKYLQPCYFFHTAAIGAGFTKEYLESLLKSGRIRLNDQLNTDMISKLGTGLRPLGIKEIVDEVLDSVDETLLVDKMISEIGRRQLGRLRILDLAKSIKEKVSNLESRGKLKVDGEISYKKVAFLAEDVSPEKIEEILNAAPPAVAEADLLRLFVEHSGIDPQILSLLNKF